MTPPRQPPLVGATPSATARRLTPLGASLLAVLLLIVISAGELAVGWQVHLSVVFLLPIYIATANAGVRAGVLAAIASSLLSTGGDALAGEPFGHWMQPVAQIIVRAGLFAAFALLLERLQRALEREKELARIDPLTGVANRREFVELATAEILRAQRHRRPLTVAYVDVDDFKQVNDQRGHRTGDELLRRVADHLRNRLRIGDPVGRLGGDEFAICLPETDAEAAKQVFRDLTADLASALPQGCASVTLSIGVVSFATPPGSVDELLHRADVALYEAKRNGKNRTLHDAVGG